MRFLYVGSPYYHIQSPGLRNGALIITADNSQYGMISFFISSHAILM